MVVYIEALGHTLAITTRFPGASVNNKNFNELAIEK